MGTHSSFAVQLTLSLCGGFGSVLTIGSLQEFALKGTSEQPKFACVVGDLLALRSVIDPAFSYLLCIVAALSQTGAVTRQVSTYRCYHTFRTSGAAFTWWFGK